MLGKIPAITLHQLALNSCCWDFIGWYFYQVLSLDSNIKAAVIKMKRDLLKLIGFGEFSEAAEWKDPCLSFVLQEVESEKSIFAPPDTV